MRFDGRAYLFFCLTLLPSISGITKMEVSSRIKTFQWCVHFVCSIPIDIRLTPGQQVTTKVSHLDTCPIGRITMIHLSLSLSLSLSHSLGLFSLYYSPGWGGGLIWLSQRIKTWMYMYHARGGSWILCRPKGVGGGQILANTPTHWEAERFYVNMKAFY